METDFENTEVETKVCPSVEDKTTSKIIKGIRKQVDGYFHVALPWRHDHNKAMAE